MLRNALVLPALASVFLTACSGVVEDTLPGQPIKHRQGAFKEILRSFEPMGTMLRTQRYEADAFALKAARLHQQRAAPWGYFVDGSDVPPTRALSAVWQNTADFERAAEEFMAATDALLVSANARIEADVRTAYARLELSCRSCHDSFRR